MQTDHTKHESKEITVRILCDQGSVSFEIEGNGLCITSPDRIFDGFFTSKRGQEPVWL